MPAAPHRDTLSGLDAGVVVPDHALLKCIGTGSYGRVFLARSFLGEFRAVKVISRHVLKDHRPFDRELRGIRKFEPISRSHPGFLNILHVGQDSTGDYFYSVMELGDDASGAPCTDAERYEAKTLQRVLQPRRPLPPGEVLRFALCLTDALQHLHAAGLVHRDIKPANILFVGGVPKFGDIGLVTLEGEAESLVGTIGYIPPEGPGTCQADVFALGKVLYECLTGLDRTRFPEMPTLVEGPDHGRFLELNEVVLKACHSNPTARYSGVRAMLAEVQAIREGKSVVQARRIEQTAAKRKRVGTFAMAAVAVLVGAGLVFQAVQHHRQGQRAEAHLTTAIRALDGGDYLPALNSLASKVEASQGGADESIDRLRFAATFGHLPKLTLLKALGASLSWCEFTPDDQGLLVATANGRAELRSTETGDKLVEFIGHTGGVLAGAISGNGAMVATAGEDSTARLWEAFSGRQVGLLQHVSRVTAIRFHPTAEIVITGCADGRLRWWNQGTGTLIREVEAHSSAINSVALSHDGRWVVSGGRDGKVRLWTEEGQAAGEPLEHSKWVLHVDLSADGASLLASCADNFAYLWDVRSRTRIGSPLQHTRAIGQGAFSRLGRRVLTCGWDGTLQLWDAKTGGRENPPLHHGFPVTCAGFSHDSRRIVSGCTDGTLRVWDLAGRNLPDRLAAVALSQNGRHYVWTNGGTMDVRSFQSPKGSVRRITPDRPSVPVAMNDAATLVAVVARSDDDSSALFRLWETTTGKGIAKWTPIPRFPSQCIFAAGQPVLALSDSNLLHLVNATSGELRTLVLADKIRGLSFSGDGRWLAVASATNVHVLAANTGSPRYPPLPHTARVSHVEFSPGSDRLVSCTSDGSLGSCYAQVWEAGSGRPVGTKLWHHDGVRDAVWFPGGKLIATAAEDGVARTWDVQTSRQTGPEIKHLKQAVDMDLSGERLLLTASWDKSIRISDASSGLLIGPPQGFSYALESARWLPDEAGILVRVLGGVTWLQRLRPLNLKPAFLLQLADVLNARLPDLAGRDPFEAGQALERNWRALKASVPSLFTVSTDEIVAWCWTESSRCRASDRPAEELLFMERILALRPEDPLAPIVKWWIESKETASR